MLPYFLAGGAQPMGLPLPGPPTAIAANQVLFPVHPVNGIPLEDLVLLVLLALVISPTTEATELPTSLGKDIKRGIAVRTDFAVPLVLTPGPAPPIACEAFYRAKAGWGILGTEVPVEKSLALFACPRMWIRT